MGRNGNSSHPHSFESLIIAILESIPKQIVFQFSRIIFRKFGIIKLVLSAKINRCFS